jgi:hypothetical protein
MSAVQSPSEKGWFWSWIKYIPLSLFTIVFSLNSVLVYVADGTTTGWKGLLFSLSLQADRLYSNLFAPYDKYFWFSLFVRWVFFSIAIILGLILLLCFIHRSSAPLTSGISGFGLGLFLLTALSLGILLFGLIKIVILWISQILQNIIRWFMSTPLVWCLALLVVIAVIGFIILIYQEIRDLMKDVSWKNSIYGLFLIGGFILFIWVVIQALKAPSIAEWITWFIALVTQIVLYALGIMFLLVGMIIIGRQFIDQFVSAKITGSSTISMFDTGFNIGAAMALSFLVIAAVPPYEQFFHEALLNSPFAGFDLLSATKALVPDSVLNTVYRLLAASSLPIFDFFILFLVCLLTITSLVVSITHTIRIYRWRDIWATPQHRSALMMTVFGVLFTLALMMSDSLAAEEQ